MGIMLGTCKAGRYSIKVTISIIPPSMTMILYPLPFHITPQQVFYTKQPRLLQLLLYFIFHPHPMGLSFSVTKNPDVTRSHNKKKHRGEKKKALLKNNEKSNQVRFFVGFSPKPLQHIFPFQALSTQKKNLLYLFPIPNLFLIVIIYIHTLSKLLSIVH